MKTDNIEKGIDLIDAWKVFVPYASPGDDSYPHLILSKPIIAAPKVVCTETYLVIGAFPSEQIAKNVSIYMKTSFFRFMILLAKSTQHITQKNYIFVPTVDFSKPWYDSLLYDYFDISHDEQAFIDTLIRPMELDNE